MEPLFIEDVEELQLFCKAREFVTNGDYIKALEILEDMLSALKEDRNSWGLHFMQGLILNKRADEVRNNGMDLVYSLGAVGCYAQDVNLSGICAPTLYVLGRYLNSALYYKNAIDKAKQGLSALYPVAVAAGGQLRLQPLQDKDKERLEKIIKDAASYLDKAKERLEEIIKDAEFKSASKENSAPVVSESKKSPEPLKDENKRLRSFWVGLDVKIKRDFMKVSIAKLLSFVEGVYKREGRHALEEALDYAKKYRKWQLWRCRTLCWKEFSSADECKTHFEQKHDANFKPSSEKDMVKRIGKDWARKIFVGDWEPVDTVAAVEMIKTGLKDVKAFASKNGWSREWPLAVDDERKKLLKDTKQLLVSISDHKVLSCSIRDWVMGIPARHLGKRDISDQNLVDYHLVDTPQSICFLDCDELNKILEFLKCIKRERNDGTTLVCKAVDSFLGRTRVREKIDFDPKFSLLLLDKRLLKSHNGLFNDEETINVLDPNVHYAKAPAHGDDFISSIVDYDSVDKIFPRPIREYNLDIWIAVMKATQFTCMALRTKYAKKVKVLDYHAALTSVENLCVSEDDKRKKIQEDQWNRYACLLCNRCEEIVLGNSPTTKLLLCAVRDVLEGALHPTFDFPDLEECLKLIRERKSLSDGVVLKSIDHLKSMLTQKVLLIDSKILLIDNSRISLLNNLTKLSVFDNRTYILTVLKPFLLNEILNMESKAKANAADAAEADLLLEEEKKSQSKKKKIKAMSLPSVNLQRKGTSTLVETAEDAAAAETLLLFTAEKKSQSKKKKNKGKKRNSTSMSIPLDKAVAYKPSVDLEPEGNCPSLTTVEDTLASERGRLEISSNNDNQEEDMEIIPGEDSRSVHVESALVQVADRYNSALDMTLKAVLNIKVFKEDLIHNRQAFHDDLEEKVPYVLQEFFSAFLSEEMKDEGCYKLFLRELLASLEIVHPMSSKASEVLVAILELWHCWKNPERVSLVTRLFTLEENERMNCRKCRRNPNYPEQSSYGIVMAADSIRELKCSFGDIKFVDILKVIRMESEILCDIKTGGCGKRNFVHHTLSRLPSIFTIVLEWEKSETEKEISETTNALEWEIDISRLYKGLKPTNYRLVSMVGCGEREEEEYICLVYEKNRWVYLRSESSERKVVGNWKNLLRFCGERNVRPEILFYEVVA